MCSVHSYSDCECVTSNTLPSNITIQCFANAFGGQSLCSYWVWHLNANIKQSQTTLLELIHNLSNSMEDQLIKLVIVIEILYPPLYTPHPAIPPGYSTWIQNVTIRGTICVMLHRLGWFIQASGDSLLLRYTVRTHRKQKQLSNGSLK